jgi:hypothetical protein
MVGIFVYKRKTLTKLLVFFVFVMGYLQNNMKLENRLVMDNHMVADIFADYLNLSTEFYLKNICCKKRC